MATDWAATAKAKAGQLLPHAQACKVLHALQLAGVTVEANGDKLKIIGPPLTADQRQQLTESKAAILEYLGQRSAGHEPWDDGKLPPPAPAPDPMAEHEEMCWSLFHEASEAMVRAYATQSVEVLGKVRDAVVPICPPAPPKDDFAAAQKVNQAIAQRVANRIAALAKQRAEQESQELQEEQSAA
jgi:hypothetical protein